MTADEIVEGILRREGGWRPAAQRPDGSWDSDTMRGITWPTYLAYCEKHGLGTPSRAEHRNLTEQQARSVYTGVFIVDPGFTQENIPFEPLRVQLIDFGVNSGPATAVRWLQRILGGLVVDGVLGPKTVARLKLIGGEFWGLDYTLPRLINDALVAARVYMVDRAVDSGRMRKADEEGVESRALEFFLARP